MLCILIAIEMALPGTSIEYLRLPDADRGSKLMVLGVIFSLITAGGLFGLAQIFSPERRKRLWKQVLLMASAGLAYLIIYLGIIKGMPKLANVMGGIMNKLFD